MQRKVCTRCGEDKPLEEFNRDRRCRDGKRPECKTCHRMEAADWREKNLDRALANYKRWRTESPEKYILSRAKRQAKAKGREFSITEKDFDMPTHCPVLGVELIYKPPGVKYSPNSASLDRMDSSKGYVPGNVAIVSWRANTLKGDATPEELEKVLRWMLQQEHSLHEAEG